MKKRIDEYTTEQFAHLTKYEQNLAIRGAITEVLNTRYNGALECMSISRIQYQAGLYRFGVTNQRMTQIARIMRREKVIYRTPEGLYYVIGN